MRAQEGCSRAWGESGWAASLEAPPKERGPQGEPRKEQEQPVRGRQEREWATVVSSARLQETAKSGSPFYSLTPSICIRVRTEPFLGLRFRQVKCSFP
jgi:hypothetical protein